MANVVTVPRFYRPRPYQQRAWQRRMRGEYNFDIKLWARQCIAGDTTVWTPNGLVSIRDLRPGDTVYSLHIGSNGSEYAKRQVSDVWRSAAVEPCISVAGAVVSYDHPFFDGSGYTPLYQLVWEALNADQRNKLRALCETYGSSLVEGAAGDRLYCTRRRDGRVLELHQERTERLHLEVMDPVELYDMTVETDHNFLIGDLGLVVSNCGKDTDDIEFSLHDAFCNPGTQTAYVGLDNKWVSANIFNKYLDGRRFWSDYPNEVIEAKDTQKEVLFHNNPEGIAEARVKFIGFQNDQALIGSSYDRFYVSEASLYGQNAFQFIEPIWENKLALGENLRVYLNGTPRGMQNVFTQMLQNYTGEKDPEAFPGPHVLGQYRTYVDKVTIEDVLVPDGQGGWRRLYDDAWIERMKQRYMDAYGNLNLFMQEFYCDFTTVNSGLVYQGVQQMIEQGRTRPFNLDTSKPVYVAFDISSKDKLTDATVGLVFQHIGGNMLIYDMIELRGMALVQVVAQLSVKEYWPYVRVGFLPWDADRSASSETPIEEARRMFPNVTWHALEKERIDRGIQVVREAMPNMYVHGENCRRLMDSLQAYEFKRLERQDDWSAVPMHNWASHACDALRYACMGLEEMQYLGLPMDGSRRQMPTSYEFFGESGRDERPDRPVTMMTESERRRWLRGRRDTGDGDSAW